MCIRDRVSEAEVKEIVSDETASILIEKEVEEEKIFGNKKGIINIDTISRNFEAGDIVTINSLKDKKLIDKNVCFVDVYKRQAQAGANGVKIARSIIEKEGK